MTRRFTVALALAIFATGSATGVQAADQKFEKDGWTYIETAASGGAASSFLVYKAGRANRDKNKVFVIKCDAPGANAIYLGFFGGDPSGKAQDTQATFTIDDSLQLELPVSLDGSIAYVYDGPSIAKALAAMQGRKKLGFEAANFDRKNPDPEVKTALAYGAKYMNRKGMHFPVLVKFNVELAGFNEAYAWVAKNCTKA